MSPLRHTTSSNEYLALSPNSTLNLWTECSASPLQSVPPIKKKRKRDRKNRGGQHGGARPGGGGPGKPKRCRQGCGQLKASCQCP